MGLGELDLRTGNYDSAQTYLERALQLYRETGNRLGEIFVLYDLGESAYVCGDFARAQAYYEQVLHASHSIGYKANEGSAFERLGALIIEQRGDYTKAQFYFEEWVHLSEESGNRLVEIVSPYYFGAMDLMRNNYLAARIYTEQALQTCRNEIVHKYFEGICLQQLGNIASQLGEYASALEYYHQGISISREMGERDLLCQILMASGMVFYYLGQYEKAQEYNLEAFLIAQEIKNKWTQSRILISLAHMFRGLGNLEHAADSYQHALILALELRLPDCYAKPAQTGLAAVALAQSNLAKAQASLDEILHYLETTHLSTLDEIFWIYLTCYHILQASADPRTWTTLEAAYNLLQEIAARIDDEISRASFLQKVHFNREIVELWDDLAGTNYRKTEYG
jgi:tetratricopeptide (TPR) repeat protein